MAQSHQPRSETVMIFANGLDGIGVIGVGVWVKNSYLLNEPLVRKHNRKADIG